eukprot:2898838-Prymnesium_polylepis.1
MYCLSMLYSILSRFDLSSADSCSSSRGTDADRGTSSFILWMTVCVVLPFNPARNAYAAGHSCGSSRTPRASG